MQALRLTDSWPVDNVAAAVVLPDGSIESTGDQQRSFRIASVAKTITTWACLVAVEEGIVALDQPVGQPGCTLRHLLCHAGGYGFDGAEPIARPERTRIYSNTGIEMAANAVADAAGITFADYLGEAVLSPLAMSATALHGSPAHRMSSTAADLTRFIREVRQPRLISLATATEARPAIPRAQRHHPRHRAVLAVPVGPRFRGARQQAAALDRHNELAGDVWTLRWGRYLHVGGSCRGGGLPRPDRSTIRRVGRRGVARLARLQRRRTCRGLGMMYRPGDRVRFETTGDDGWPLIRYGFVGGVSGNGGPVVVMLDGELTGDVVNRSELQPVSITSVELCLRGVDLIDDPDLRKGLVALWHAEADSAGLDVDELHPIGDGKRESDACWALAELMTADQHYVVRAIQLPNEPEIIRVRAEKSLTISSAARRSWPCPGRHRRTCSPGRRSCPRTAGR